MNDAETGTKPKKVKKTGLRKGHKWTAEQIKRRTQTRLAKLAAKNANISSPDVVGAIAALRKSKRAILQALCSQELKDLGDVELGVFEALRHLQGG